MSRDLRRKKNSIFHPAVITLTVISTVLNIVLSMIVRTTELPFYIDTVGTLVAAALGGIVPGVITAFFTNAINFFMDGESIFYASLNMLIAVIASAYFGGYSGYRKKEKRNRKDSDRGLENAAVTDLILFILVLALVGGGIGAEITWYLYETPSDAPMVVSITEWLSDNLGIGVWGCHMISTYITDVMDKGISVAIALVITCLVPNKAKEYLRLSSWRQKPLSYEERINARKNLKGGISIGVRINVIIIISTLVMTVVAFVFSVINFRNNTIESLKASASQIAYLASKAIDADRIDEYIDKGTGARGYDVTKERLSLIKESSSDIAFLYVYKVENEGCKVIFDLDATLSDGRYIPGDPFGKIVEYEDGSLPHIESLLAGEELPVFELVDDYGSFYAAYAPVYNDKGRCVCYAISNVETGTVDVLLYRFAGRVILLFSGFLILIVAITILTTRYRIVMPIMSMTAYANELVDANKGVNEESLEKIEELDIRTDDEIEQLYRSLCKLTGDTVFQLNDNRIKSEAIAKMQNVLIVTMADMVESRDSDTGAHVLKTAAYVRIIVHGLKRNGYYAEKITDKYMRDVEMSAPLHDVGKINIPDAVLNKPGKLTDEEYEIMKSHTTAGKLILEKAISSMEGDNYLKEARNMAAYHHERWDGKGYPEGLHGEVIPLSARIMAVADVFDALSSPRVYKPAFPIDKAIKMIEEGAGTQFDPKCVEVFVESIAEVRKVHKKYSEM